MSLFLGIGAALINTLQKPALDWKWKVSVLGHLNELSVLRHLIMVAGPQGFTSLKSHGSCWDSFSLKDTVERSLGSSASHSVM